MTIQIDDFYRSSNGDRWRLVRDTETGHRAVRHEPNLASGGRVTETPVEDWLDRTGTSPENAALRSLLAGFGSRGDFASISPGSPSQPSWRMLTGC